MRHVFKRALLLLAGVTVMLKAELVQSQTTPAVSWAICAGGKINEFASQCVADSQDNCYIAGAFNSDGKLGNYSVTAPTYSGRSFIAKLDGEAKVVWYRNLGGEMSFVRSVYPEASGNVIVTGTFMNKAVFGAQQLRVGGRSGLNCYIAKYDSQGNALWCRGAVGKTEEDVVTGSHVSADSSGNCYISGNFIGRILLDSTSLITTQSVAFFLAKYDSEGTLLWTARGDGNSNLSTDGLAVDSAGNCYLAGTFGAFYDKTNSHSMFTLGNMTMVSRGREDVLVAKYTPGGQLEWRLVQGDSPPITSTALQLMNPVVVTSPASSGKKPSSASLKSRRPGREISSWANWNPMADGVG